MGVYEMMMVMIKDGRLSFSFLKISLQAKHD